MVSEGKKKTGGGAAEFLPAAAMILAMALAVALASIARTGAETQMQLDAVSAEEIPSSPDPYVGDAEAYPTEEAKSDAIEDEEASGEEEKPKVFIEVNIPATEMTLFENESPLFRRRVAIGSGVYPTPALTSFIRRVEWNPWWYPPPYSEWAKNDKPTPPGPGNPLGLAKIPLSGDILFHGTNKEWTVGTPASHGCMRMKNSEVTALAWYLQKNFSDKRDPALRETYRRNRGTTYTVHLDTRIPVELVYRPVVARNGSLLFYPDHYNRLAGRRKAGILGALLRKGFDISTLDEEKIASLAKSWPSRGSEVDLRGLMIEAPSVSLLDAPLCE